MMVPKLFLCCSSSFVRLWFHMWRLFYHYLFLISAFFGATGMLCFVIVPGYLHLYFNASGRVYAIHHENMPVEF